MLKIFFKNKKYYFNIFLNKKYFKNNYPKTESQTAFNIKTKYNYSVSEKKKNDIHAKQKEIYKDNHHSLAYGTNANPCPL